MLTFKKQIEEDYPSLGSLRLSPLPVGLSVDFPTPCTLALLCGVAASLHLSPVMYTKGVIKQRQKQSQLVESLSKS